MYKDDINSFLDTLHNFSEKLSEAEKCKEQFNIFSILYKPHNEKYVHSRFIASLLNPHGSHNMGSIPLRLLLRHCGYDEQFINKLLENNNVTMYPREDHLSEHKYIDILAVNRSSRHAFFMENKINAKDSNHEERGQLEGYYDELLREIPKENIELVFLSMWGREPSDESYGNRYPELKEKCMVLTYNELIIPWLEDDAMKQQYEGRPFLRETVNQYINLVRKMTNDINIDDRIELRDIIGSSEANMKAAKLLTDNFKHVKWHTVEAFWNELSARLEEEGIKTDSGITADTITALTHHDKYRNRKENNRIVYRCPSGLMFYLSYNSDTLLFYGAEDIPENDKFKEKLSVMGCFITGRNDIFNKEFNLPYEEKIYFSDFSSDGTFNLINPSYRKKIIYKIVCEIITTFR